MNEKGKHVIFVRFDVSYVIEQYYYIITVTSEKYFRFAKTEACSKIITILYHS